MTYRGQASRTPNRVLTFLVIITIVVVAYWAVSGGLDDAPPGEPDTASVAP